MEAHTSDQFNKENEEFYRKTAHPFRTFLGIKEDIEYDNMEVPVYIDNNPSTTYRGNIPKSGSFGIVCTENVNNNSQSDDPYLNVNHRQDEPTEPSTSNLDSPAMLRAGSRTDPSFKSDLRFGQTVSSTSSKVLNLSSAKARSDSGFGQTVPLTSPEKQNMQPTDGPRSQEYSFGMSFDAKTKIMKLDIGSKNILKKFTFNEKTEKHSYNSYDEIEIKIYICKEFDITSIPTKNSNKVTIEHKTFNEKTKKYSYKEYDITSIPTRMSNKVTIEHKIKMGARVEKVLGVFLIDGRIQVQEIEALIIYSKKSYRAEILCLGQMGSIQEKGPNPRKKEKNMGYILFCVFFFPVDFQDFYVYGINGKKLNTSIKVPRQWPWRDEAGLPVLPPLNDKTKYKDLCESITSVDHFFNIFSAVIKGHFCCSCDEHSALYTDINTTVMQLCLALGYSEPIRNFKAMDWNRELLDHRFCIPSVEELKIVIALHPMVTKGSYMKGKTGYCGHTKAAEEKVGPFRNKLMELKQRWQFCMCACD